MLRARFPAGACGWAVLVLVAVTGCAVRAASAPSFLNRPDAWFTSDEGRRVVDNILSWQGHGPGGVMGWPKAYDASKPRPADGAGVEWEGIATIDNDATHSELRILAQAATLEKDEPRREKIENAFFAGLDAMLAGQYANGGWPQRFPPPMNYGRHITFNDNAMTQLMEVMKEVGQGKAGEGIFGFVDEARRKRALGAFDKGVECILKCQILVDGKLTGWCAQYDEVSLAPAGARAYELPSISGSEGAAIAILLMRIEKPDERVKKAVEAAATWFDSAKIVGKRVQNITAADGSRDRVVVDDPGGVLWARFYDLDTGKPFFSGRDGVKRSTMAEIEQERRRGYAWYGIWGTAVAREYAAWKKRLGD